MNYSFRQEKGVDYHHCMTLGKLLSLSGPQFPHYYNYGGKPVVPKYENWAGCSESPKKFTKNTDILGSTLRDEDTLGLGRAPDHCCFHKDLVWEFCIKHPPSLVPTVTLGFSYRQAPPQPSCFPILLP